ncbi:hypothetical protein A3H16_04065 [Candidatus Kaiserbacteria bacterium RIFCSPLOWO2_12_FULL_53_8]|uniref:PIN domain-containing protein n=2 Tax=Candidatus Kaiseribacteriota TaxID=1752734 RepID=A0A1F6CTJ1_9BACT|nr:MAG: hypothetical protein A2851_05560 [Candidatus Kaiserbacteria bacterium RIFCSPHIGHO2_01_FULL_53_29]OGG92394.1 MAG: hypothetical protein A3H16_04065 [Candidatus Kaiserbacteria bacterium RIFCSPLOWO2_12_FULL_53_8]
MAISKSRGVIFDTNVWIALLHEADSQYRKAQELVRTLATEEVLVPEYVLVEVSAVLKRYERNAEAIVFVKRVLGNAGSFIPAGVLAHETSVLFEERNDKLSFVDTALLVLSREYRVITFDKALARALP